MSKKLSNTEFINKCKKIHNNKYDYSLTNYITAKTKIDIICPIHGIFKQEAFSHKIGQGCSKCSNNCKLLKSEFIEKSNKKHNNKYDYSLVEYNGNKNKVKIICPEHGIFEQVSGEHLKGNGCPKCVVYKIKNDTNYFIEKSNKIHNNKYNYSLVEYSGNKNKVKIICQEHGTFMQIPSNHLKGHGCTKCKNLYNYNTNGYIKIANKIHKDKYDYSLVNYKNAKTKIKIICKTHNLVFNQTPNNHLSGQGCPKCANNIKLSTLDFITTSNKKHIYKYDYSLSEYENSYSKVIIVCPIHGEFKQNPSHHKNGGNCPFCINKSNGEEEILDILEYLKIIYIRQKTFNNCKNYRLLPFDFYLPELNICIEFDGKQHFEPISRFGGEKEYFKNKFRDEIKNKYCKNNNINLIRIKYDEDIQKKLIEKINFINK